MRQLPRAVFPLLLVLCLLGTTSSSVAAPPPSDLDGLMQKEDGMVYHRYYETCTRDLRYDELIRHIGERLTPHVANVYPHPKAVVFYVFIGHMGFNATTWDRISIFDSLLLDSMRRLSEGVAVYGTTDCEYVHTLAEHVVRVDRGYRAQMDVIGPVDNPFLLPTLWGLTSDQRTRADVLFEEMLAGWMAHEASHALLNHSRDRVQAMQLVEDYRLRNLKPPDELLRAIYAPFSFTRQKEREADDHGIRLILRAGYKIDGLIASFEFAQQVEGLSGEDSLNERDRTHPTPLERIIMARQIAAEEAGR